MCKKVRSMDNVERILSDLLADFDTLSSEKRTYKLILDDAIRTSTGSYVTSAKTGYFPNTTQPAFLMLRAATYLCQASQEASIDERLDKLEKAIGDVEKATWAGVDQNTGMLKSDFLELRQDKDARSSDEFNNKLGELYNYAGDMFEAARGNGVPEVENMFTAIAQIALVCSVSGIGPFSVSAEEQSLSLEKAKRMIEFALRVSEKKK